VPRQVRTASLSQTTGSKRISGSEFTASAKRAEADIRAKIGKALHFREVETRRGAMFAWVGWQRECGDTNAVTFALSLVPCGHVGVFNPTMTAYRRFLLVIPMLLAAACGGSGKTSETPATTPASDTAAPSEAKTEAPDVTAKSESSKSKVKEVAEPESTEPECTKDKDCTIFADCCTCKAVLAAGKPPVPCDSVCGESKCETKGKTIDNVACVSGRCKLK
jgi:hypothetical protein